MAKATKPIPDGYHTVTPYLVVQGGARALDFYTQALGATVRVRMDGPGGKILHAEFQIGDSMVMMADEHPEMDALSPQTIGGSPVTIHLYVEDVDRVVQRAVAAGAKLLRPVVDQFYGDRAGAIVDPFGHKWYVATHVEDLTPEEIDKRAAAAQAAQGA